MPKKFSALITVTLLTLSLGTQKKTFADTTPPTTSYVQTPSSPNGNFSWYVSPISFTLNATDLESGVKEINYQVDGGTWQKTSFVNTLNLAPNPSFETANLSSSSGLDSWDASVVDPQGTYTQDVTTYATGFQTASAKIDATGGTWHGINNKNFFSVSTSYANMAASAWVKTQTVTGQAYINIYALTLDQNGNQSAQLVGQTTTVAGTNDWVKLSANFVVNAQNVQGVYVDIGFSGSGTLWADAVSISQTPVQTSTNFTVGSDSTNHVVAFYSVDFANNTETYKCTSPIKNCVTFKLDQSPPTNWNDSGAVRNLFSSDHVLWVYTNVEDATSGISTFTNHYTYYTERNDTFGRYPSIFSCNGTWQPNVSVFLISPPFFPGSHSVYLVTPPTDFCNSNWKICKIVRFYAEDMAGNSNTKDFCINGPWISFTNKGFVRSNQNIDMLSEAPGTNTDGLIEAGGNTINFFTSSKNWEARNTTAPTTITYDDLYSMAQGKTTITDGVLKKTSGNYKISGDFTIDNGSIPSGYSSSIFNQVVFVSGNLTISKDITVAGSSTALFVVKGNVNVAKAVNNLGVGIISDGDINTAYDIAQGEVVQTLNLNGVFNATKFVFQRTLQGTNNSNTASEKFTYEPKYLVQLKDYLGTNSVKWQSVQ